MSLLKSFRSASSRRSWISGVFALLVLPLAILATGCDVSAPDVVTLTPGQEWIRDNLAGNWTSQHGEFMRITNAFAFSWGMGGEHAFETTGTAVDVVLFNEQGTHGIIFVRLNPGMTNWDGSPLQGFTGYRFNNLTASQVNVAASSENFLGATTTTLAAAKEKFTVHTLDTYFANMTSLFTRGQ